MANKKKKLIQRAGHSQNINMTKPFHIIGISHIYQDRDKFWRHTHPPTNNVITNILKKQYPKKFDEIADYKKDDNYEEDQFRMACQIMDDMHRRLEQKLPDIIKEYIGANGIQIVFEEGFPHKEGLSRIGQYCKDWEVEYHQIEASIKEYDQITNRSFRKDNKPGVEDKKGFYDRREKIWVERIESKLKDKPALLVCGEEHALNMFYGHDDELGKMIVFSLDKGLVDKLKDIGIPNSIVIDQLILWENNDKEYKEFLDECYQTGAFEI